MSPPRTHFPKSYLLALGLIVALAQSAYAQPVRSVVPYSAGTPEFHGELEALVWEGKFAEAGTRALEVTEIDPAHSTLYQYWHRSFLSVHDTIGKLEELLSREDVATDEWKAIAFSRIMELNGWGVIHCVPPIYDFVLGFSEFYEDSDWRHWRILLLVAEARELTGDLGQAKTDYEYLVNAAPDSAWAVVMQAKNRLERMGQDQ